MSLEDLTTEQLLTEAKRFKNSHDLVNTLLSSPDTREDALRLLKKKNPAMSIPELDSKTAIEARLAEESEARRKLEERVQQDDIMRRIEKERARVMKQHDLTDADMAEVEKIMTDKDAPIPHYDAAAKVFKASKQQATPTPIVLQPPVFDMPDKDVWGPGVGNRAALDKIAMQEAYKALNEINGGKKAA